MSLNNVHNRILISVIVFCCCCYCSAALESKLTFLKFYLLGLVLFSLVEMNLCTQEIFIPIQALTVSWYCLCRKWTELLLSELLMPEITPHTSQWKLCKHKYIGLLLWIVLSFILNMKKQAQYSPHILYRMFFIVWGKLCLWSQLHVYLPKKWCYFYTVYWRWKCFVFMCYKLYCFCSIN